MTEMTLEQAKAFTQRYAVRGFVRSDPTCCARLKGPSYFPNRCGKPPKVTLPDGTGWCGFHSPERVAKLAAERKRRDDEYAASLRQAEADRRERDRRRLAYPGLIEALKKIAAGDNDPRTTAECALREAKEIP